MAAVLFTEIPNVLSNVTPINYRIELTGPWSMQKQGNQYGVMHVLTWTALLSLVLKSKTNRLVPLVIQHSHYFSNGVYSPLFFDNLPNYFFGVGTHQESHADCIC